ncbi:MAG: tetratricopeptide repeat protein [Candidatus Lernaella stagnicola]|nr:tetratricopeptide repeat protein [Candidatus Lernaella stagnicola]
MRKGVAFVIILVLLAGAVLAGYWNAPQGDFIWDDINLIVFDYQIKSWNFMSRIFTRDFFGFSDDNRKYGYYRPLVTITYALDWKLWRNNPAGYHWTNLLLHFVATVLVFLVFFRLAGRTFVVPLLAGLAFAVHPIHTESVTWISGRTDVVCALFYFAGLLCFMIHAERIAARRKLNPPPGTTAGAAERDPWLMLALSILLFMAAVLSKEMALSLPIVTTVFLLIFVTGLKDLKRLVWFIPALAAQAMAVGGYFLYRYIKVGYSQQAKDPFDTITTILSFIKTIGYYSAKIFVPVHLSAYIQNPLVESVLEGPFLAGFVFVAALVALTVFTWRRDKIISFSILFYLASLLPLSNFIRISGPKDMGFMTAERFLYIPSAPFLLLIAVVAGRLLQRLSGWLADRQWGGVGLRHRLVAALLVVMMLASLTALTVRRNMDWYDNETLFTKMIEDAPNATLLYVVLGNIYRMAKKYDRAEAVLNKALEYIAPRDREEPTWIYNDLAGIYAEQHRFDEALQLMKFASRTRMHNSAVLYNYGEIYRAMGDCRTAIEYYQRSLVIHRDNRPAFIKMGLCFQQQQRWELSNKSYLAALELTPNSANLLNQVGYNYLRMRNLPKAEYYLADALQQKSNHRRAVVNYALLRFEQEKTAEAVDVLQQHLEKKPRDADAHAMLGTILSRMGRLREAGPHIKEALAINPKHVQARLTLATLNLEKFPDKTRGILHAILQDVPGHVESTYAIGRSYELEGKREEAIHWFKKTLELNPGHPEAQMRLRELAALPATGSEDKTGDVTADEE